MSEQQPETGAPEETGAPDEQGETAITEAELAAAMEADDAREEEEARESDEVEGRQGEQGEQEQPEAQALSQKQLEAAFGKLERETERHGKRVAEIMGDDFAMMKVCPLCEPLMPGFVMDTPALAGRFPTVRMLMGDAQPAHLKPDPDTSQCEVCGGEGMLDMLSKVEGQQSLVCGYCGGRGWVGQRHGIATSGPMAVQPLPDANGQSEVTPQGPEPPEAAKLRAMGYTLIQPVGAP